MALDHATELAHVPHLTEKGFGKKPFVMPIEKDPESDKHASEFTAYLMLPNLKGYLDKFESKSGRVVSFIMAVPIYQEEYELAQGSGGPMALFNRFSESKTKPRLAPGRPNLGLSG